MILKHMFTLQELDEDPAAVLDIKEDIRDECGKVGDVTNVVLFDKEVEGVASVRFSNAEAAKACVRVSFYFSLTCYTTSPCLFRHFFKSVDLSLYLFFLFGQHSSWFETTLPLLRHFLWLCRRHGHCLCHLSAGNATAYASFPFKAHQFCCFLKHALSPFPSLGLYSTYIL